MNQSEIIKSMIIPITGARKIKATVFMTGSGFTVLKPPYAMAAPENAPIKACDDDDGIPNHQVSRFQKMAASRPEKITTSISWPYTTSVFTVFAIVLATPWSLKIKKATKLNVAAQSTACVGVNTFVETTVAIEFAAS
jgi:hypothetical protein